MVCLARKKKTAVFRQYVAAETAVPVIACAACLPIAQEKDCTLCNDQHVHTHTHTHSLASFEPCSTFPLLTRTDFFAGVARSKSVRNPDDGVGPNVRRPPPLEHSFAKCSLGVPF